MAADSKYQGVYPQLVTKIIASYVSHHNLSPEQIERAKTVLARWGGGLRIDALGKLILTRSPF